MKFRYLLAASLAVAVSAPGFAKDDGTASAPKEKKVCKTERVTGSLTRVNRICMTAAEWNAIAESTRKTLSDQINRASVGTGSSQMSNGGAG